MTEARIRAAAKPLAQYLVAVFDLDEELALESAIKITERQLEALEAFGRPITARNLWEHVVYGR